MGQVGREGSEGQVGPLLVMELVEGPTLADRIAQGAIPLDEALNVARQIAEALDAAHETGIIHRDLKPANIKVRPDGLVKVLDFGLAKAIEGAGRVGEAGAAGREHLTQLPTITSPAQMTGPGLILGTAAYMSPEQARGTTVDRRGDLWAFGVVLYEMLTGTRLFEGATISDTLAQDLPKSRIGPRCRRVHPRRFEDCCGAVWKKNVSGASTRRRTCGWRSTMR